MNMLSVAGGDDDGDDVQVSFNDKLVAVVRATQVGINRLSPLLKEPERDVLRSMVQPHTAWQSDAVEERGRVDEVTSFRHLL